MAKRASVDVSFFVMDGLSLLGYSSELSDAKENIFDDAKPLGAIWPVPLPTGDKMAEFAQAGWFDDATNGLHEALNEQQGVSRTIAYGYSTNTVGQPFSSFAGIFASKYSRIVARNLLHRAKADYKVSGVAEEGVILHALGAETADGNSEATSVDRNTETTVPVTAITSSSVANPSVITCPTPHNLTSGDKVVIAGHSGSTPSINGAQTATVINTLTFSIAVNVTVGGTGGTVKQVSTQNGGAAHLQMTAITLGGYTDLLVTIRHSQDNVTFVDLVALTARTTIGAERKTVAGTVYRYLAHARDFEGAGSGASATYMAGFARW